MESSFPSYGACAPPIPRLLGSQVLVQTLLEQGVEVVFGYLGAAVMSLYDEFGTWRNERHRLIGLIVTCYRRIT